MSKKNDAERMRELEERVRELEAEVSARESDLSVFRQQLLQANQSLESLIEKLSADLRTATRIQKTLVPTEFPNIPGFEFSTKFVASPISGGDYFDVFEHDDRMKFGLVMASANGYGLSALLLSVLLRMTGQDEARRGLPPNRVIQYLAEELEPSLGEGPRGPDQASLIYGIIDRRTMELSFSAMGPVYGGLYRPTTGKMDRIQSEDSPIEKGSYTKLPKLQHLQLEAKDRLVLVSPGAVMVQNAADEKFGEERLMRAILTAPKDSVHDWRNEILFRIEQFAGERDIPRDVTVMVLEVKDRVIRLAPR